MTPAEQIRAVRKRIAPPGAWLPISFAARTSDGRTVQARNPEADAWGVLSALTAISAPADDLEPALTALRAAAGAKWFCDWEEADGRTQAQVLEVLDKAVADLESHRGSAA